MITYKVGNIFEAKVQALVNPVNTVGVMGKGLAAQFKKKYPANFIRYRQACTFGELVVGEVLIVDRMNSLPKYIINFPTKEHWKNPSRIEYIEFGLRSLIGKICILGIKSVAMPHIGCGLGGLNWWDVNPLITKVFEDLPEVQLFIYSFK